MVKMGSFIHTLLQCNENSLITGERESLLCKGRASYRNLFLIPLSTQALRLAQGLAHSRCIFLSFIYLFFEPNQEQTNSICSRKWQ